MDRSVFTHTPTDSDHSWICLVQRVGIAQQKSLCVSYIYILIHYDVDGTCKLEPSTGDGWTSCVQNRPYHTHVCCASQALTCWKFWSEFSQFSWRPWNNRICSEHSRKVVCRVAWGKIQTVSRLSNFDLSISSSTATIPDAAYVADQGTPFLHPPQSERKQRRPSPEVPNSSSDSSKSDSDCISGWSAGVSSLIAELLLWVRRSKRRSAWGAIAVLAFETSSVISCLSAKPADKGAYICAMQQLSDNMV